eukprot:1126179-Prorocentrum_minimum.AAC.5
MRENGTLETLDLSGNGLGAEFCVLMAACVKENAHKLKSLVSYVVTWLSARSAGDPASPVPRLQQAVESDTE